MDRFTLTLTLNGLASTKSHAKLLGGCDRNVQTCGWLPWRGSCVLGCPWPPLLALVYFPSFSRSWGYWSLTPSLEISWVLVACSSTTPSTSVPPRRTSASSTPSSTLTRTMSSRLLHLCPTLHLWSHLKHNPFSSVASHVHLVHEFLLLHVWWC